MPLPGPDFGAMAGAVTGRARRGRGRGGAAYLLGIAVGLCATTVDGAAVAPQAPDAAPSTRNVLLLVVDDMRLQFGKDSRFANTVQMITPNLDRLASSSTWFDNAVCQVPICAPSRVSFLTSRRPDTTRFTHMPSAKGPSWRENPWTRSAVTLPQL